MQLVMTSDIHACIVKSLCDIVLHVGLGSGSFLKSDSVCWHGQSVNFLHWSQQLFAISLVFIYITGVTRVLK